ALAQPPERDQGGNRGMHLALRQLGIFPPRTPAVSALGTESSQRSKPSGVSTPGIAGPRTDPGRFLPFGPRNIAPRASAKTQPAASFEPLGPSKKTTPFSRL